MEIEMWMEAKLRFPDAPVGLFIPCQNRGHPCNHCGHYWLSTDALCFFEGCKQILVYEFIA